MSPLPHGLFEFLLLLKAYLLGAFVNINRATAAWEETLGHFEVFLLVLLILAPFLLFSAVLALLGSSFAYIIIFGTRSNVWEPGGQVLFLEKLATSRRRIVPITIAKLHRLWLSQFALMMSGVLLTVMPASVSTMALSWHLIYEVIHAPRLSSTCLSWWLIVEVITRFLLSHYFYYQIKSYAM